MTSVNKMLLTVEQVEALARGIHGAFQGEWVLRAQRHPQKAKAAWERLMGMCDAANRLGFGMTPHQVLMAMKDTHDSIPWPVGSLGTARERRDVEAERIEKLTQKLWEMR